MHDNFDAKKLGFDRSTQERFQSELKSILSYADTISRLERELVSFGERIKSALSKNEFLDAKAAVNLHLKCAILLVISRETPGAPHTAYLLAAVSSLIREEHSPSNALELDGFEDDLSVLDRFIAHFGLSQLVEARIREVRASKELKIA